MSMSVDGLVSGMDTTTLISQLLKADAAPQTALKSRLSATQNAASAYRTVNTVFAAIRAAAEALTPAALSAARKASSSDVSVSASAAATAVVGSSVSFTVKQTASTQSLITKAGWTSPTTKVRDQSAPSWPIDIINKTTGVSVGTVDLAPDATLTDAAAAINAKKLGITASVIRTAKDEYRLQLTSQTSGAAGAFTIASTTDDPALPGSSFQETIPGQDATLDLGGGIVAKSATNTFTDLLAGVSITVSKGQTASTTIAVGNDVDGVTTKVQTLVDAVNSALTTVKSYTSNAPGSTATLKGEFRLTSLASQVLNAVSSAVGADGSPAKVGLELTKDGKINFKKEKFTSALTDTPELAQRMIAGQVASLGADGVVGGGDDKVAVTGIAGRLLDIAKKASDSTTGSIVALANGQDSLAEDIQDRIDAWDLRLAKRKETLTRQFTAMETALSSLKNQSSWLSGQISSLPTNR
jgi:flagellar hook-associated protein 2